MAEIIERTVAEFQSVVGRLAGQYLPTSTDAEAAWADPALIS